MSSKTYDLSAVHGADLAILKEIDRICPKAQDPVSDGRRDPFRGCPPQGIYPMGR